MGQRFKALSEQHIDFISNQKIFFVGTATAESLINISPKGMDSFKVLDSNRVAWLNVTGSGNETAAHVQQHPRMTIMFIAFDGSPMILRLYGKAVAVHPYDAEWEELNSGFPPLPGARQIFKVSIELVQTSCGMSVPLFDYVSDRDQLNKWAIKKGEEGVKDYWKQKNQLSLDGLPTNILGDER